MFGRTQEKLEITNRRVSGPRIRIFFIISIFFPQFWPTDQTALSGTRRVEFFENAGLSFSCVRTKIRWCHKSHKACPIREALSKLEKKISIFKKSPDTSERGLKFFTFYLLTCNSNAKSAFCCISIVVTSSNLNEIHTNRKFLRWG